MRPLSMKKKLFLLICNKSVFAEKLPKNYKNIATLKVSCYAKLKQGQPEQPIHTSLTKK
jgi:hypothetical protein